MREVVAADQQRARLARLNKQGHVTMMRESTDKGCYVSQTHALRQRCRPMEQGRMAAMPQAPSAEVKLPRTPRCSAIQRSGPLGLCPGAWHQSSAERSPARVRCCPCRNAQGGADTECQPHSMGQPAALPVRHSLTVECMTRRSSAFSALTRSAIVAPPPAMNAGARSTFPST